MALNLSIKAEINKLPSIAQAEMLNGLYSERSEIGDKVEVKLQEPLNLLSERIFVPVDSVISGQVMAVQEAERGLKRGKVKVVFKRIYYPNGYFLETEGYLMGNQTNSADGSAQEIIGKSSWKQKLLQVGKIGAGALLGGPVGAAAAAGTLIFDKGGKVRIQAGETVRVQLSTVQFPQSQDVKGKVRDIYSPPLPGVQD